jgi:small-conductance mechanosensitive channel
MDEFLQDVLKHLEHYYNALVNVTPKIGLAIIAFLISWFIASKAQTLFGNRLKKKMHDPLLALFLSRLIKSVVIVIGVLLVLRIIGLNGIATSLLAGAGISAFVIGFALKDIGENFLAGILLAFKRPFHIGETIESNGIKGKVISLNLRDTQILADDRNIYLPNALLIKSPLTNFTREGYQLQNVVIGVEYGADYQKAVDIVSATVPKIDGVVNDDKKTTAVFVSDISINAVNIKVVYWILTTPPVSGDVIKSNVIIHTLQALADEGFNIPSNVVELKKHEPDVYKNGHPLKLRGPVQIEKT